MLDPSMLDFVRDFIESRDPIATKLERRFPFRRLADHCFRCYKWAQRIGQIEGGDPEVAQVSALFHDIGKCLDNTRERHGRAGAEICGAYLARTGFDLAKRERITRIVALHVEHCRGDESSIEARIESDADVLDEIGAVTVLWDCMAAGAEGADSYCVARDRIQVASANLAKKTRASCQTEAGWQFFLGRGASLQEFLNNLDFELGLTDILSAAPRDPGPSPIPANGNR